MRTGLVLEGGAMRGMFTAGVIDIMMENNIIFDGVAGVSAGSVFGCNYKSGQIGRAIRYNKKYCRDKRYVSWSSLLKTGNLYNAEFGYDTLINELDIFDTKAFSENPSEFYVTCTDVETGNAVYHKCIDGQKNDIEWMRASASMPVFSKIVEIDGYKLLDGGIADSIPLKFLENNGYNKNVVVLTQPDGFVKKKNKYMSLIRLALRKYPDAVKAMSSRHIRYNDTLKYIKNQENYGNVFVIRPPFSLNVGSMERDAAKLESVYQTGRKTAQECLEEIKEFIQR